MATALSTALTLDRVVQRLAQTGATIDEARAQVKSISLAARRDFETGEGAAGGAAAIRSLLKGSVMPTTTAPLIDADTPAPEPPTRTPRRLPPAVLVAAVASAQAQQQATAQAASAGGKRTGKRGASASTPAPVAADARQLLETPGDGAGVGRPSVPDATPRIVGLIRKGKNAQPV